MPRKYGREAIEERLRSWEDELVTNRHRMAHVAEQCIADLKEQLAEYDAKRAAPAAARSREP